MSLCSLGDVFAEQIGHLYGAETQLVAALRRMAGAAEDPRLRDALQAHLAETQRHVERLRAIISDVGIADVSQTCEGMAGLLTEGEQVVRVPTAGTAKDAALLAAAQRVEHYEIASYCTARTLAGELGHDEAEGLLAQTLDEEIGADRLLTAIVTGGLLRG